MANYTLTSNANTITGSTGADDFTGTYDAVSGIDTLNSNDILNGGAGVDTLHINHFLDVAITPPDALWSGISNIEKIVINTSGNGAQTITTGTAFDAAFAPEGVDLTTTTTGAGAISLTMSSFTGEATLATTSTDGAQTIVTGAGATTVTAVSGAGALNIKGIGLESVLATTTGAGAQTIGDGSGKGVHLVDVTATSGGGEQTITSTSTSAVKVTATSSAGEQNITTGIGSDVINATTSAENNTITTNAGNDTVTVLAASSGSYTIDGGTGNDAIFSGAGADTLIGGEGNDTLDGGAGADTMTGGNGNDLYSVSSADDVVIESNVNAAIGGYDTVNSYLAAYTLGANVENGRVMSTSAANLSGNGLNNVLYAGAGNNLLNGGGGVDTAAYTHAGGAVTVSLAVATGQATGGSGSDTLTGMENLIGSGYNDALTGNAGANVLNGGAGADAMIGGNGSDVYYVDNSLDAVTETNSISSSGGTDTVYSTLGSYTLGSNVENGRILATGTANLSGNNLNNVLYAAAGNNTLDGLGGTADTVSYAYAGAAVSASLATTSAQDTEGSGIDTLRNIENLDGSAYDDALTGNNAANALDGGAGADILIGRDGSDTYYVDNAEDWVRETNSTAATGGTDLVLSSLADYTLTSNVENGRINTSASANLAGNGLNNILFAGAGNNLLDGGSGVDTAAYTYAGSAVTVSLAVATGQATGGSGSDTLTGVENLTGSAYNDTLTGNTGANVLNGGAGADAMNGGNGSDVYYVDNSLDAVTETNSVASTGGTDTVYSTLDSYTLGGNVENGRILATGVADLTGNNLNNVLYAAAGDNAIDGLGGTSDTISYLYAATAGATGVTLDLSTLNGSGQATASGISGTDLVKNIENIAGSNYADSLTGNAGNNSLNGGLGNDILAGGLGNDLLTGGAGRDLLSGGAGLDVFDFNALAETGVSSGSWDQIADFVAGQDRIDLSALDADAATATVNSDFSFIGAADFSNSDASGQLRYVFDAASDTGMLYGSTDADNAAEFAIQLTGVSTLAASDFML